MKIAVLVKVVPDTYGERRLDASGRVDRDASDPVIDEIDERALEVALAYKDAHDAEVVAVAMGPQTVPAALRKALAMGATAAVHIEDAQLAGSDAARTAEVLAAALRTVGADLVLAGNESTDGRGGVVPAMIAEHLGLAHASYLDTVEISPASVRGIRSTESGTATVSAALPAIVSVTERTPEARFPKLKGLMTAKRKPVTTLGIAQLGLGAPVAQSLVLRSEERAARSGGVKVVDDGRSGEGVAEFLAASRLI